MKFCQPHWDALRQAIDVRGLSGLVAKDGKAAAERMARELQAAAAPADFDPLMSAHWAIAAKDMEVVGLAAMAPDHCPLCSVEGSREGLAQQWINGCCDDILRFCREQKLVPEAS